MWVIFFYWPPEKRFRCLIDQSSKTVCRRKLPPKLRITPKLELFATLFQKVSRVGLPVLATPVQFLNDRLELSLGLEVFYEVEYALQLPETRLLSPIVSTFTSSNSRSSQRHSRTLDILTDLRETVGSLVTDAFQMSFSGNPDELGQWRGYAANGMGCSVITTVSAVHQAADIAGWVIYDEKEQSTFAKAVLEKLRNETNDQTIERILIASVCFIKHSGFQPETEFRLIKFPALEDIEFRETGDRIVPYIDYLKEKSPLPLLRILIGPGWQLSRLSSKDKFRHHVVQGINRLLESRGLKTGIDCSVIPYDPK